MGVIITSYELTKLDGKHGRVVEAFRQGAMLYSTVGNTEQFYMPGGKLTLELRKAGEATFLDVKKTSRKEPAWVKRLVKDLGGKWAGSYESGDTDKLIALLAKSE